MNLLLPALPLLLPLVVRWAAREERRILRDGVPLDEPCLSDARQMGVSHPGRVRLLTVDRVPLPANAILHAAGRICGLVSGSTAGMSLRYGIFIRSDFWNDRHLIAHECVHTAQYESLGSIRAFLQKYLRECLSAGYLNSPMELEAISKSAAIDR